MITSHVQGSRLVKWQQLSTERGYAAEARLVCSELLLAKHVVVWRGAFDGHQRYFQLA